MPYPGLPWGSYWDVGRYWDICGGKRALYLDGKGGAESGKRVGMGMGMGPNCKHHLSHTDSVRLRLLLTIRFGQFGGECGAMGALNVCLGSPPLPIQGST